MMLTLSALVFLILLAAFFSVSETSMMAVNRYRLRHLSRKNHKRAALTLRLLERPDRLLGVILIGNTFANILASAIATLLAMRWFGDTGVMVATLVLTLFILIFAETAPKTLAVLYAQRIALLLVIPLACLLKILYPIVWVVNGLANGLLWIMGVRIEKHESELLSIDELRSIVYETTKKSGSHYQEMLLRVLDMQQVTVEEVMVPKNEIHGIDLDDNWDTIIAHLKQVPYNFVLLYRAHIEKAEKMLNVRRALVELNNPKFDKAGLLALSEEIYFIPEGALLHQQLLNFQKRNLRIGLVVDEYGDIQGLLTLKDLLEEIVGDFGVNAVESAQLFQVQADGSVLVDGGISIRDLNRLAHWHLPVSGSRTLSGLIIEYLEGIPKANVSVRVAGYPMEVLSVSHNTIEQVLVWPQLYLSE